MAFCRFGNGCDFYCYQAEEGFQTMLADHRAKDDVFLDINKNTTDKDIENYLEKHMEKINLPYAGEIFGDDTLQGMLNRILRLREIGYLIPQEKIDNIQKTIDKEDIFY